MTIATKLEGGAVVKTVNKPDSEISTVEGNVLKIWKRGERFSGKGADRASEGFIEAEASTTILTLADIDSACAVQETVGDASLRDILLVYNQTQREDCINSLAATIRGDSSGLSTDEKAARAFVKTLKALDAGDAKKLVKATSGGLREALAVLIESDEGLKALLA